MLRLPSPVGRTLLLAGLVLVLSSPLRARQADPIPPAAPEISDAVALRSVPPALLQLSGLLLVLDRQ